MITASLVLLAIALAADAFAVALGQGAAVRANPMRTALIVGLALGAAQAIAPLIGWSLGVAFADAIESYDHWVAFGLLLIIGVKLIWDGARSHAPGEARAPRGSLTTSGWTLLLLAIATSIDAAAAGVTLPTLGAPILPSIAIIGGVTFVLSAGGVLLGRTGARVLGSNAEIIGGLILMVIGAKVLIDHKAFGSLTFG
jgi:putative Mn2+ efflux pump MntP